jgi:hypothetical protein
MENVVKMKIVRDTDDTDNTDLSGVAEPCIVHDVNEEENVEQPIEEVKPKIDDLIVEFTNRLRDVYGDKTKLFMLVYTEPDGTKLTGTIPPINAVDLLGDVQSNLLKDVIKRMDNKQ